MDDVERLLISALIQAAPSGVFPDDTGNGSVNTPNEMLEHAQAQLELMRAAKREEQTEQKVGMIMPTRFNV